MRKSISYFLLLSITLLLFTYCTRQSRRDRIASKSLAPNSTEETSSQERRKRGSTSVVKMHSENGVYYVPCKINGVEMKFIFDTGASDITISLTEALFLYKQGKLTDEDFIGSQQYQVADGSIHEGAVVILKTVEIGDRELQNVKASIMDNLQAPLLLGQSALAKFGKISIDYNQNQITFE